VYPKVSGLAAWSDNSKWYSSLPLGAVVSLFYQSILVSFATITLCVASQRVFVVVVVVHFVIDSFWKLLDTLSYTAVPSTVSLMFISAITTEFVTLSSGVSLLSII
jgi:hypothetical protein